ncbi:uncharacterized protein F5Z01DRAFT_695076 [Emericellopsis atlantica]|uniref:Uncharacterized protein n=1 Tax=Emericellopsis atlantica TaxID=2614577 RepID=A0A9P7ZSU2_9HYPO|nr:uncharacterized protein F5Z01DRAFT_695076 [Emericellopsis atlantica]KAG9257693.1 hypothetical protein F5Z01DRAFT_695076 [Emericellopsis atlantica]
MDPHTDQHKTDEELDRDWKPSGRRPQSGQDKEHDQENTPANGDANARTMARSFSAELMDIFRIENSVSDLDSQVHKRKHTVQQTTTELASLEARLKEMEARLKHSQARMSISGTSFRPSEGTPSDNNHGIPPFNPRDESSAPAVAAAEDKARSRPGTAKATQQAPSSGDMPPTPGASEDGDRE